MIAEEGGGEHQDFLLIDDLNTEESISTRRLCSKLPYGHPWTFAPNSKLCEDHSPAQGEVSVKHGC